MKLCVRDFSVLAVKDPLFPAEVAAVAPAQPHRLQVSQSVCTGTAPAARGLAWDLISRLCIWVSDWSLSFFLTVYLQVSDHTLWHAPLLRQQHWHVVSNQTLQGKVSCSPFSSSVSCCVCISTPPHPSISDAPFWAFQEHVPAPPIVPISTSPTFAGFPEDQSLPRVCSVLDQPI